MDPTVVSLIILFVIAGVCGAIAQGVVGYSHGGFATSIALGFIGALVGMWIAGGIGLPDYVAVNVGGEPFPIVWSILGAVLFVVAISLFVRRRTYA